MKALVYDEYGHPERVLQIVTLETPVPKKNEVLVKISTTTVNDYDWAMITGKPYLYRLMFGVLKPKRRVAGMELAGTISKTGSDVKQFTIGDAVYGDISDHSFGTFAEYICVPSDAIQKIPAGLDMVNAVALPHASLLALQAFDQIALKEGEKVLINGGGGGVGTIALQLAKLKRCEVTGVDSGKKLDAMKSMGFDHVLDYKKDDFTKKGVRYDVILDCKTMQSAFAYGRALTQKGRYISIGGKAASLLSLLFWGRIVSIFTRKKFQILALKPNQGLDRVATLFLQHQLTFAIDGPHTFEELPSLIQYFGEGKHFGKIVVKMD